MPKKTPIHKNADANITCDFGDGDIGRSRSRLPHTRPDGHIVSSIIVRLALFIIFSYTLTAHTYIIGLRLWFFHKIGVNVMNVSGFLKISHSGLSVVAEGIIRITVLI